MGNQLNSADTKPTKWWQWVLLYPGALIAVLGAVPQYSHWFEAFKLGVSSDQLGISQEQIKLWEVNIQCPGNVPSHFVETPERIDVTVTVCPTGDILVETTEPGKDPQLRWVGHKTFDETANLPISFGKEAFAVGRDNSTRMIVAQAYQVICTSRTSEGLIKRRLRYPDGHCIDEWINPATGKVVRTAPSPSCSNKC